MLILRSHGFGFADVGLAETPCRFSDAVSVCLTSDFWGLGFITLPMSAPLPTLAIWFRDVCEAMRSLFLSDENLR